MKEHMQTAATATIKLLRSGKNYYFLNLPDTEKCKQHVVLCLKYNKIHIKKELTTKPERSKGITSDKPNKVR